MQTIHHLLVSVSTATHLAMVVLCKYIMCSLVHLLHQYKEHSINKCALHQYKGLVFLFYYYTNTFFHLNSPSS